MVIEIIPSMNQRNAGQKYVGLHFTRSGVLTSKFGEKIRDASIVIPAQAGRKSSGPSKSWIPARASYRQLGRNDGKN
jgi:hypothetical protein